MKTMKTCKTGCGKMKSGGSVVKKVKKMAAGGQMYGIPQTGPTGPNYQGVDTMKKGGAMKKKYQDGGYTNTTPGQMAMPPMKKGGMAKAKFGATTPVKASCKNGMVRGADGKCVMERPRFKKGGTPFGMLSVKAGVDKNPKPTAADRIASAKMKKGGMIRSKKK